MDDASAGEARYDPALGAWILSRYADVYAALREPRLSASGHEAADGEHTAHVAMREAAARALASSRLADWRGAAEKAAHGLLGALPTGRPVDLVRGFAVPWSLQLALLVSGGSRTDAESLTRLAREVFLAAARATRPGGEPPAQAAALELARHFQGAGAPLGVQSFVALSQTLPCVLASAWLQLCRHPDEAHLLRSRPMLMPHAVEELLRHAGPSRAVFRYARDALRIGRAPIARGDHVILMLAAANHDADRFPDPDRLDFGRGAGGHLAFGSGTHSCVGAQLIRMAVGVATHALLRTTTDMELIGPVEWTGGFAIRAPASLPVVLRREP